MVGCLGCRGVCCRHWRQMFQGCALLLSGLPACMCWDGCSASRLQQARAVCVPFAVQAGQSGFLEMLPSPPLRQQRLEQQQQPAPAQPFHVRAVLLCPAALCTLHAWGPAPVGSCSPFPAEASACSWLQAFAGQELSSIAPRSVEPFTLSQAHSGFNRAFVEFGERVVKPGRDECAARREKGQRPLFYSQKNQLAGLVGGVVPTCVAAVE